MKAGLNLYSIRTLIGSEASFLDTAVKLREMGYAYLQYSGAPFDADAVKRVSAASGLPVVLTHVPMDRILHDTEALMEEHGRFGCRNIGLGMMPQDCILDERRCKETVEALNLAGEKMAAAGFRFFYHHHHFEFYRHGGETVLEYMIANAPHIHFTLDTYWVQYGGGDIIETVNRLAGRIGCVHLKDYRIADKGAGGKVSLAPVFAPVGDGTLDFPKIVEAMRRAGTEYFLVEQDNAVEFADPLAQVERSVRYLERG